MSTMGKDHIQLVLTKENAQEKTLPQMETVIQDRGYIVIADAGGGFSIQQGKKNLLGNV